jgi:hypothetical protein
MKMAFICLVCRNKGEIPAELDPLVDSLRPYYSEIIYCKALETIVVANPDNPCQLRDKCEKFEQAESG